MKQNNATAIDIHNKMNIDELENLIKTNARAVLNDPSKAFLLPPTLIHGSPGVGKSSIVKQVADDLGVEFIDVRLSQYESVDLRGLPSVDKEKHTTEWNIPSFWPTDPNTKAILFFDEIMSVDKSVQVAAYQIILDRCLSGLYKLPDGVYIVAAGNLTTDRAVATTMSSALANRFLHVDLDIDHEVWVKWAQQHGVHPSVTGFINYRPGLLFNMKDENLERGWPSPRSWEKVSRMIDLYGNMDSDSFLRKIIYGLIGNRAGVEFMEFYKINANFDSVLDMMLGRTKISIPEKVDQKYAMCSAISYLVWRGKDETDQRKRLDGFFDISIEMSSDFASMLMMSVMTGINKGEGQKYANALLHHPKYKEWAQKHGKALRKRYVIG